MLINLCFYKIKKNILINYFNFTLSLIFGLRYDMGIDYLAYRNVFYNNIIQTRFEYGYLILSNIVKSTINNFTVLIFMTVFLQIYFFSLGLKKDMIVL